MPLPECLGLAAAGAAVLGAAFKNPLWFISVGYGAAMSLQSAMAFARHRATLDAFGKAHLALVGLYGVRLTGFLLWRDRLSAYQPIKAKHEAYADTLSVPKRVFMWAGCSLLYLSMFMPALWSARPGPKAPLGSPLGIVSTAGLAVSGACLAWEAAADAVQQLYYERGGKRPCRVGPWAVDHQANYHGEIGYWLAGYVAGLRSYPTPLDAGLAAIGAASITWIVQYEGKRRKKRQAGTGTGAGSKQAN